jgi:hypothetical protein
MGPVNVVQKMNRACALARFDFWNRTQMAAEGTLILTFSLGKKEFPNKERRIFWSAI